MTVRRLQELERLVAALRELMAPGALRDWMITPSDAFEGSTPVQLIERGEADRIWQMEHLNNPQRRSLRAIQGRAVSSGVSGRELRDAVEGLGVAIRRT